MQYNSILLITLALLTSFSSLAMVGCGKTASTSNTSSAAADAQLAVPRTEVKMVRIPAGEFIRGSNKVDNKGLKQQYGFANELYLDEHPQRKMYLDEFYIDTYEVTNALYKEYILSTHRMLPFQWINNGYSLTQAQLQSMETDKLRMLAVDFFRLDMDTRTMEKPALIAAMLERQNILDNLPVGNVSWFNAKAYCEWRQARLPTEAEWEKAARGESGREYPWGNEWDPNITNTGDNDKWENGIAPVGSYPKNQSPYGVYDMAGNVWEWVADWYDAYPGSEYHNDNFGQTNRVIRGGGGGIGHYSISYFFRAASRQFSEPEMESDDVGFRCAKEA